jgi:hypothetical protein
LTHDRGLKHSIIVSLCQGGDVGASHDTPTYTGPLFDQTPSAHVSNPVILLLHACISGIMWYSVQTSSVYSYFYQWFTH